MKEIYKRQVQFQERMQTNFDTMYLALIDEIGELIASFGYADWKKNPRDEDNIIVEAMDICIFAMNCNYYSDPERSKDFDDEALFDNVATSSTDVAFIQELIRRVNNKWYMSVISLIFNKYPTVKSRIIGKQVLNVFRQDNGYKEGLYKKMWGDKEDNDTMLQIVTDNPDWTFEDIYTELHEQYEVFKEQ